LSLSEAQVVFKRKYVGRYAGFHSDFDVALQNPILEIPAFSVKQRLSGQIDDAPILNEKGRAVPIHTKSCRRLY